MAERLRVIIEQPVLAHYRFGVFEELASRSGIELTVVYDHFLPRAPLTPLGFGLCRKRLLGWPLGKKDKLHFQHLPLNSGKQQAADVALLEWSLRSLTMPLGLAVARRRGIATVLWGHGYSLAERAHKRWLRGAFANLADAVLFYDAASAEPYIEHGLPRGKVFVAPNTLDLAPVYAAEEQWTAARLLLFQKEQRLDQRRLVLFASRLQPGRRLVEVITALARLPSDVELGVLGTGPEEDAARHCAEQLGVAARVRFLGALYDELKVAPWFLSAKVLCVPCRLGLGLIHAFGYGLPAVASSLEAMPELSVLRHEVNGLRVAEPTAASLAEALRRVLDNPVLQATLSLNASRTVRTERTLSAMVDGMEAALRYAAWARRSRG